MFKNGDPIIWFSNLDSADGIRRGTITKIRVDQGMTLLFTDLNHAPEDCLYAAYAWPARVEAELVAILEERARLKKAFDDSMKLVYELRNAVTRGEK